MSNMDAQWFLQKQFNEQLLCMFMFVCVCVGVPVSVFVVALRSVCLVIKAIFVALNLLLPHDFFFLRKHKSKRQKQNKQSETK